MSDKEDNIGVFTSKTTITIIIIFAIIFVLQLLLYISTRFLFIGDKSNATLITNLNNKDNDKYNELSEIYLFCSYMPFKKIFCGIDDAGMAEKEEHATEITRILDILEKKKNFIVEHYEGIKANSDNLINKNKEEREKREFEEEQRLKTEAGKDGRYNANSRFLWITSFFKAVYLFMTFCKDIVFGLGGFIMTIFSALLKNKVVMGFLIIVIIIIILLSMFKPKSSKKEEAANTTAGISNVGLSPTALYNELLDTYKYYNTMVKDLNTNMDILGTSTADELNENDEEYDETTTRKILAGKRYDNLSYINLSSLETAIQTQIKKIYNIDNIDIEADKYYNIYLPSEKFNIKQDDISWKISNKDNNEKKWGIDCKMIGATGKQGSSAIDIDAFISNEGKCIINEAELKKADRPADEPPVPSIYKTEYIK